MVGLPTIFLIEDIIKEFDFHEKLCSLYVKYTKEVFESEGFSKSGGIYLHDVDLFGSRVDPFELLFTGKC